MGANGTARVITLVVVVAAVAVLATMLLTPVSAGTCRVVGAKTCSDARSQSVQLAEKYGMPGTKIPGVYAACLKTGTWAGPSCTIRGLRRE